MKSMLRSIFVGPTGIRSGWRLLIFLAIGFGLQVGLGSGVAFFAQSLRYRSWGGLDPIVFSVEDGLTLIAVLAATIVMARFERRKLREYGLPGRNALGRKFWEGGAFGFCGVTLLIVLIAAAGGYSPGPMALHGSALLYFTALWVVASLFIGFAEEFLFRGYPQFILGTAMGFWPAAFLISFLFGALHFFTKPHERWTDWASTGLLALLVCLTLRRTGDLRFAIGFHAAFDFGAIFVYGGLNGGELAKGRLLNATFHGPDWLTGGPLGPEASLMVFPVIALMFLGVDRLYRAKGQGLGA